MGTMIEAKQVTRRFGTGSTAVTALHNISLSMEQGGFHILRGPSGSGKTTLMNLLSALDRPTEGSILLDGQDICPLSDNQRDRLRQRQIGFVFQSVALFPHMTALENVDFGLRIAGVPSKGRLQRAREYLDMVGMKERIRHFPSALSGGEQQRVAIARAIAHRPRVLFADEPTAQLDSRMGFSIVQLLRRLTREDGITVVMTTHDPDMMTLGDYLYTLRDGELVE